MGLTGTTSRDDAERQLGQAIDLGELTAQHAPQGHPIFAALDRARQAVELLQDEEAAIPETIAAGSDLYTTIDRVIDGVFAAAAEVRNDPDEPLPLTMFSLPKTSLPWIEIAAGGGALVLGWFLFRRSSRRRYA